MSSFAALFFWLMSSLGLIVPMPQVAREEAPPSSNATAPSSDSETLKEWLEAASSPHISNGF